MIKACPASLATDEVQTSVNFEKKKGNRVGSEITL